jgi:hypothetical protein
MNRFDEAVTRADDAHRLDMRERSERFRQAIEYARAGIDPDMPLFSGVRGG